MIHIFVAFCVCLIPAALSFQSRQHAYSLSFHGRTTRVPSRLGALDNNTPLPEFTTGDEDEWSVGNLMKTLESRKTWSDLSGSQQRKFVLGQDIILTNFVGNMGFDEIVDWEYYYLDEDGKKAKSMNPSPFDTEKPTRTRQKSGGVVRIFRGEFGGTLGSVLRSRGADRRVLLKEFSGDLALDLAKQELKIVGKLQSDFVSAQSKAAKDGEWARAAFARSLDTGGGRDDAVMVSLTQMLAKLPFTGILGELNIDELDEDDLDPTDWYRGLGVKPPKPGSIWIVYEYVGLTTLSSYAVPALKKWEQLPIKRGVFGNPVPPAALPFWNARAGYVVMGVLKQALEAVAFLHDQGVAHFSIGKSSIVLSSLGQDKLEASSPYATAASRALVKLNDFGFARICEDIDDEVKRRAKPFGIIATGDEASTNQLIAFQKAEDLHALGFVFLGILLTTLAEPRSSNYPLPQTDEDSLQQLLGTRYKKDVFEFRSYCESEDAWDRVVALLDENDCAGWDLLQSMCFAREQVARGGIPPSGWELLSSPFFNR